MRRNCVLIFGKDVQCKCIERRLLLAHWGKTKLLLPLRSLLRRRLRCHQKTCLPDLFLDSFVFFQPSTQLLLTVSAGLFNSVCFERPFIFHSGKAFGAFGPDFPGTSRSLFHCWGWARRLAPEHSKFFVFKHVKLHSCLCLSLCFIFSFNVGKQGC